MVVDSYIIYFLNSHWLTISKPPPYHVVFLIQACITTILVYWTKIIVFLTYYYSRVCTTDFCLDTSHFVLLNFSLHPKIHNSLWPPLLTYYYIFPHIFGNNWCSLSLTSYYLQTSLFSQCWESFSKHLKPKFYIFSPTAITY